MIADPFVREVLQPGTQHGCRRALLGLIDHAWNRACRAPDPSRRRRRQRAALLSLLWRIQALSAAGQVECAPWHWEIVLAGLARYNHLLARFRYEHRERVVRRIDRDFGASAFPLRDPDHGELRLVDIPAESRPGDDGRTLSSQCVLPYLEPHVRGRVRAQRCRRWLQPARLERRHLRSTHEAPLLGQWGVFAARRVPAGTCVGVFGGLVLDEADGLALRNHRHAISASAVPGRVTVNGENILSLVNTLFETDEQGVWTGHPATGFNTDMAQFDVRLSHGWDVRIVACVATQDIPAGNELRWSYRLGAFPSIIQRQG